MYQTDQRGQLLQQMLLAFPASPSNQPLWCYSFSFIAALFVSWPRPQLWPSITLFAALPMLFSLCPPALSLPSNSLFASVYPKTPSSSSCYCLLYDRAARSEFAQDWAHPFQTSMANKSSQNARNSIKQGGNTHDVPAPDDYCLYTQGTYKNPCKCFLRGRWDQRALLAYTILWFCHLFANKKKRLNWKQHCSPNSTQQRSSPSSAAAASPHDLCCDILLLKKSQFNPIKADKTSKVFFCNAPSNPPMETVM